MWIMPHIYPRFLQHVAEVAKPNMKSFPSLYAWYPIDFWDRVGVAVDQTVGWEGSPGSPYSANK